MLGDCGQVSPGKSKLLNKSLGMHAHTHRGQHTAKDRGFFFPQNADIVLGLFA